MSTLVFSGRDEACAMPSHTCSRWLNDNARLGLRAHSGRVYQAVDAGALGLHSTSTPHEFLLIGMAHQWKKDIKLLGQLDNVQNFDFVLSQLSKKL